MKRLTLLLLIGLVITLLLPAKDYAKKVDELMSAYQKNCQFNGTVLIKKGDKIFYKKAFGCANREWDVPNDLESNLLFRLSV